MCVCSHTMSLSDAGLLAYFEKEYREALDRAELRPHPDELPKLRTLRTSLLNEIRALKNEADRSAYRLVMEGYDRRLDAITQKVPKPDEGPRVIATPDDMLKAAGHVQTQTKKALERTRKTVNEAKDIALEVTETLAEQNEQIDRIDDYLHKIVDEAHLAERQLASIARRVRSDKVIWACVLLFIVVFIIVIALEGSGALVINSAAPPPAPPGTAEG